MKRYGPDSLNSWLISFACCFINMMLFGMVRLSGVLFVASGSWFNVSRDKASFPYTFATFMRNASGPLVGFLGHRYGVRLVASFGCLFAAIGVGTCYFAESISTVTFLWGVLYGLGFGLGSVLLPVSINQYFEKHRATASGISYSGACLGSFLLPPIVEILLNNYGLSGTFLFLSGFILNCVPAALLLKKPDFEIKTKSHERDGSEIQSIVPSVKVRLYTMENNCPKSLTSPNNGTVINTLSMTEDKSTNGSNLSMTYDEKMKRLSTQTLLSNYSIRMSISEPLDVEQIIGNCNSRKTPDELHDEETLTLSSDLDVISENDDIFERDFRSRSFQYEKPIVLNSRTRSLSSENIFANKERNHHSENDAKLNFGYRYDIEDVHSDKALDAHSNICAIKGITKSIGADSHDSTEAYVNYSYQKDTNNFKILPNGFKNSSNYFTKSLHWSDKDDFKMKPEVLPNLPDKELSEKQSPLGSFSIIFDPMFILIAITNAIYCFTFVCVITVIVDFARDLQIGTSNEKYILMSFSVGDFVGHLALGWITDRGYMSTAAFAALCFACQGMATAALVLANGFSTLIILVTLYGVSEAGLILIFPIIVAQYIDHDKQTVAIPSSNFLSGPLCLLVAPMIGYFRDESGSYDYVFYVIGILSAACCLCLLFSPCVVKCQARSKRETSEDNLHV